MKTIKQLLITIAVLLCCLTANAYDFEVDGIYYNIISATDFTAEVCEVPYGSEDYTGDIVIPSTVIYDDGEYSVIFIESFAFYNCTSLTSIEIPNSVIKIGFSAFENCTSLTSIEIPNSVIEIGYDAFENCTSLTSVTFEENSQLTTIERSAFSSCTSLTSVTFEENSQLTTIESFAFYNCTNLTSIEIPNSVIKIGFIAFENCTSLTSIEIPNSVIEIGHSAFVNCTSLTSITIPNGVTSIEESTFSGCSSLSSVTIGYSVEDIGESAFSGCSSLTDIYIAGIPPKVGNNNFTYAQYMNTTLYVPEGLLERYKSADVWRDFINIKECDNIGIEDTYASNIAIEVTSNGISFSNAINSTIAIYNINGVLVKRIDKYAGKRLSSRKVFILSVQEIKR